MGVEFELKYRATPETLAAIRAQVDGQVQHYAMHTTYYDTPEGALSARHYTLRRRMENDRSVCTLKYPAGSLGRGEIGDRATTENVRIQRTRNLSSYDANIISQTGTKVTPLYKNLILLW